MSDERGDDPKSVWRTRIRIAVPFAVNMALMLIFGLSNDPRWAAVWHYVCIGALFGLVGSATVYFSERPTPPAETPWTNLATARMTGMATRDSEPEDDPQPAMLGRIRPIANFVFGAMAISTIFGLAAYGIRIVVEIWQRGRGH